MIFGMFRKSGGGGRDDDDDDEEIELVSFLGALNGKSADLAANGRLAQAGLIPAKELVTDAITRRAEMVRVEPKGERASVTMMVDGVAYAGSRLSKQQALAITGMLKLLGGMDAKLRGRAQSGGLKADLEGIPYEVLIDVTPLPEGAERLVVRLRNLKIKLDTPDDLAYSQYLKTKIRELTSRRRGLLLVVGPPNSGTTTTLFGVLRGIDVYLFSIFSIANLGTRDVYNINKFEVNEGDDLEASIMRMKRAEADVILVDPVQDAETARTLLEASEEVCLLAEMAAKDSVAAVGQLMQWTGDPKLVAKGLDGVFSQKLIRLLCTDCREAFRPNPKLLEKVGLPPETKVLYRKGEPAVDEKTGEEDPPCKKCNGVGYYGRVAMIELLTLSDELRKLISSGNATPEQIRSQARNDGMLTFQKDGLRLVAEGKTSLEELQRVFKAT
ncbi:GspE/PulE family protein [Planctellipticum variicoloris]|uniref:GspE/PulE family protein n=1 Tax=Planctellipticum variicoloris TaxID=3064265 RepID=UPI0030132857|nr:Flp pilus assembly complex ATPase component TadA [Planctomycetaceae bacterium SH412]